MKRLLADENFPYPVTEKLREIGHDVVTMTDLGKANQSVSDEQVLSLAIAERRAILTHNRRDFMRLHNSSSATHSGIIVCTFDPDFIRQACRIDAAIAEGSDLTSKLIRVTKQMPPSSL